MMLLVQSCSKTKQQVEGSVPAIELYDGYFYRIIKKAMRNEAFDPNIRMKILSAKHGIIDPMDAISYYDTRMTPESADDLRDSVINDIKEAIETTSCDCVWINAGGNYESALNGLENEVSVPVNRVSGGGIGEKGNQLKNLVRTDVNASA